MQSIDPPEREYRLLNDAEIRVITHILNRASKTTKKMILMTELGEEYPKLHIDSFNRLRNIGVIARNFAKEYYINTSIYKLHTT